MTNIAITNGQLTLFLIFAIWTLFWKGLALWKSAGEKDKIWFILLLVINTLGILDIIYIFVLSKRETQKK